jgi:hypothetical protein
MLRFVSACIHAGRSTLGCVVKGRESIFYNGLGWGWMLETVMNGGFAAIGLWKTRIKSGENDGCKVPG